MLNPQEGGRLDAKRHYVILAKALDGIWPLVMPVQCSAEALTAAVSIHFPGNFKFRYVVFEF